MGAERVRALVIEDGEVDTIVLTTQLRDMGYDFVAVDSAEAAGKLLAAGEDFSLFLVDWNLPGMDGLQFVKDLRARYPSHHPKMMMVTGQTDMAQIEAAIKEGIDEYLMKPITRETFREKLKLVGLEPIETGRGEA